MSAGTLESCVGHEQHVTVGVSRAWQGVFPPWTLHTTCQWCPPIREDKQKHSESFNRKFPKYGSHAAPVHSHVGAELRRENLSLEVRFVSSYSHDLVLIEPSTVSISSPWIEGD